MVTSTAIYQVIRLASRNLTFDRSQIPNQLNVRFISSCISAYYNRGDAACSRLLPSTKGYIEAELRYNGENLINLALGTESKVRMVAGGGFEPPTFRL